MAAPDAASAEAARQRWAAAFNAGDMAGLLSLYHPQAALWGTNSAVLLDTSEGISAYSLADRGPPFFGVALKRHAGPF